MKVDLSPYEKAINILNDLTPRQDKIITEALDDLVHQRDTARADVARLTAEVEAMRAVVEAARAIRTTWNKGSTRTREEREHANLDDALRALDALRARKVGG